MTKLDERNRLLEKRSSGSNWSPHIRSHPGTRAEYATTTGTVLLQREIGPPLLPVSVTTTMAHIGPNKECPFHPHLPCVVIPRKKPNGGSRTERGPRDDIEKTRYPLSALWMAYTAPPVEGQDRANCRGFDLDKTKTNGTKPFLLKRLYKTEMDGMKKHIRGTSLILKREREQDRNT